MTIQEQDKQGYRALIAALNTSYKLIKITSMRHGTHK